MTRRERQTTPYVDAHLDQVLADSLALSDAELGLWASVQAARGVGVSWAEIGNLLGVTAAAAEKRFGARPARRRRR